jgi:DNA gyrase subunit A
MRVPLVDGQGNFGSVDGDPPAAMRYTEIRLARSATYLLEDIEKDTVDFQPTYDESDEEPKVLPARYPNLLVNGANGIAVGMATNIPPHNPTEIIDAALHLIGHPDATLDDLMQIVPGPDFPTGGMILGRAGIRAAFETGRGSLVVRAKAGFEEMRGNRTAIVITEIPYQINKSTLIEKIAELIRSKTIEGISDMRDESDRDGMRIVMELKRDATPEVVLNHLYRFTLLQTSFSVNFLALDGGRPRLMGLKDALQVFMAFREDVILRRSRFELDKARERAHLLVGLAIAVANIDDVIHLIRNSPDAATARTALMERDWPATDIQPLLDLIDDHGNQIVDGHVRLTEAQARGILELRLARLTGLEREKIQAELADVSERIRELLLILESRPRRMEVMRDELLAARGEIASPRMTSIVDFAADQDDESLIEPGQMVVTITRDGFIKRTSLETFRQQNRGGRGRTGASTRGDDIVTRSFNAHTHQWVLFFSTGGKAFREKVWRLPEASPTAKGRALVNLLPELGGDGITAVLPLPQDESLWENLHLVFATASGTVRRNKLSDFGRIRSSGIIAMKLDEGDQLVGVATCQHGDDVFLATRLGRCIRFQITDEKLRVFTGRDSQGVRGIRLAPGDAVISLSVLRHVDGAEESEGEDAAEDMVEPAEADDAAPLDNPAIDSLDEILLTVTDAGFGKRSAARLYRVTGRGGKGIANITLSARNGTAVVASFAVRPGDGVMLVTDGGQLIRVPSDQVRVTGRASMGVRLLRVADGERVTSVFPVIDSDPAGDGDEPEIGPEPGPDA